MVREKWRQTQQKIEAFAQGQYGLWGIGFAAFLESSFLPFPYEAVLVSAMLSARKRIYVFALISVLGCLVASIFFMF